jgi:hypothetical protein
MLVLERSDQIAVPAPAAVTSDAYRAELDALRSAQTRVSAAQRRSIDYWSGGGVLRWNQIQRELVARFNLPPAPRDDGSYVAPDPDNPFADPQCSACIQLRERGAVRSAQGSVVLEVSVQPAGAGPYRWWHYDRRAPE